MEGSVTTVSVLPKSSGFFSSADQESRSDVEHILSWPDEFVRGVAPVLLHLADHSPPGEPESTHLRSYGLLDESGRPTSLGQHLAHCASLAEAQKDGDLAALRPHVHSGSDVLDVGCSVGQTLRALAELQPGRGEGIDIDARALAFGYRLAQETDEDISFHLGSAHALPFPDETFDLVLCRNALTYMHQRTALSEMARVLRPGGTLFLRFENIWYDLQRLRRFPGPKGWCCRLRDFCWGAFHAIAGLQPVPGRTLTGGRAFGSVRRLRSIIRRLGCELIAVQEPLHGVRFLGRATQTELLAKKN